MIELGNDVPTQHPKVELSRKSNEARKRQIAEMAYENFNEPVELGETMSEDRREQLMAAMEAAEEGTLEAPEEVDIEEPMESKEIRNEDISEESNKEEVSAESDETSAKDIQTDEHQVEDEEPQSL